MPAAAPPSEGQIISAYRRPDGRVGVRNHVLVLGINGLGLRVAERIARFVTGVVCACTVSGRGQIEPDLSSHLDQLVGLGTNPNVAAILVVGIDDETTALVAHRIASSGKPVDSVSFAEAGEDVLAVQDAGIRRAARLVRRASECRRSPAELSELVVGVECGHSDGTSGIVCHPVIGAAVDRLIASRASVIVGETIEWLGAEALLIDRARSGGVADQILAAVRRREELAARSGASLTGNNPGEENIRGGLSTIEEKSLGAVIKSGSCTIEGILGHGEAPPGASGLYLMDGPSFSPESMTGFAAAGAQLMLFATGPGNSFASAVAPTVKVTAQVDSARRLREQIDFDASLVFTGQQSVTNAAERLIGCVRDVAGGTLTWGEILGEGLEVPARIRGSL